MAVKKAKAKAASGSGGFCAYIGPTIRGVIQHGTIYEGSKRDALKSPALCRAVDTYPEIANMLVPGDALAEARKKINTPGSLLYVRYRELAARALKEEKS